MKRWKLYTLFILFLVFETVFGMQIINKDTTVEVDVALLNDLRHQVNVEQADFAMIQANIEYFFSIVDDKGTVLFAGSEDCATSTHEAWMQHSIVLELDTGNTVFIQDNSMIEQQQEQKQRYFFFWIFMILQVLCFFFFVEWIQFRFFTPFKKLQYFAQRITDGNLEEPLKIDKYQSFGAFSESFDMMRVALKEARRQEAVATKSKKELVAKLSHDIKTPIATIKAVSEVMQAKATSSKEKEQLAIILAKSDQVNALITNLFHATLEELEQLQVENTIQSTKDICALFEQADYASRVHIVQMEEALVLYDTLRLSQVIDNIVSNAYKYAKSDIDVSGSCKNDMFEIIIQDYGGGIPEQDVQHIQEKFYRGHNTIHQSGSGLGLYISTYFMQVMKGDIVIENKHDGLCITLSLSISAN